MWLCIPVKGRTMVGILIEALALACSQMQGVWGGLGCDPPCPAVCGALGGWCLFWLKYQWAWLWLSVPNQNLQERGNDSRNILLVGPIGWSDLGDLVWKILVHLPLAFQKGRTVACSSLKMRTQGRIEPIIMVLLPKIFFVVSYEVLNMENHSPCKLWKNGLINCHICLSISEDIVGYKKVNIPVWLLKCLPNKNLPYNDSGLQRNYALVEELGHIY